MNFIDRFGQRALRSLGQHFLQDLQAIHDITRVSLAGPGRVVLEIGPGPGVLTDALLRTGAHVVAIEKDDRAVAFLNGPFAASLPAETRERFVVVHGDATQVHPCEVLREHAPKSDAPYLAAGNLPYNVATSILTSYLEKAREDFERWTFMFQHEVALRLTASPRTKAYSSLTLAVQNASDAYITTVLPPESFRPAPKVNSAVVVFELLQETRLPRELIAPFERVARAAFSKRRKTLRNALKMALTAWSDEDRAALFAQSGVQPSRRAEELSFEEFEAMARVYAEISQRIA